MKTYWIFKSACGFHTDCIAETREALIKLANDKYAGGQDRFSNHPDSVPVEVEIYEVPSQTVRTCPHDELYDGKRQ